MRAQAAVIAAKMRLRGSSIVIGMEKVWVGCMKEFYWFESAASRFKRRESAEGENEG